MKKQIYSWIAVPFLAFAAAGCDGESPAIGSGDTAGNEPDFDTLIWPLSVIEFGPTCVTQANK